MSGFEVDLERLAGGARDAEAFAERAGKIAAELGRVLDETGAPWGTGIVGLSFSAAHDGPAAEALGLVRVVPDALAGFGTRFSAAVSAYRAGEDVAASDLGG